MLFLYRVLMCLSLPLFLCRLLIKGYQNKRYLIGFPQRFGFIQKQVETPSIWIHAVSVGEVNASVPMVQALQDMFPDHTILITTMTPTGADRVYHNYQGSVQHYYLPYDLPWFLNRFIKVINPDRVIVMETEIWPNLIYAVKKKGIPLCYVNVRLSEKSFRGYSKFRSFISQVLKKIDRFAVQSNPDANRLIRLGADSEKVTVTGSIKFDISLPASTTEVAQVVRRNLGWDRPVWVVGSTHDGEEALILDAFQTLLNEFPDLLLVLVPRHPERFTSVFRLSQSTGLKTELRSVNASALDSSTQVYVADTMGELTTFIAASDITFIGGSLVPVGGHNVLEVCDASVPVVFGEHMFNFAEIATMVLDHGAGVQIIDVPELVDVTKRFLSDPALRDEYGGNGKELVNQNKGALEKIMTLFDQH